MDFGRKATVLIGKNGTGKSSLISALRKGLSFMFAKNKKYPRGLHQSNDANVQGIGFWDAHFSEIERAFHYPVSLQLEGSFLENTLSWELLKGESNSRYQSTLYKEAQNAILEHYNNRLRSAKLPLLSFYSDSYPHVLSKAGSKAKQVIGRDTVPRDFGYYAWGEEANSMELWRKRYKKASRYLSTLQSEIDRIKRQLAQKSEREVLRVTEEMLNERLEAQQNDARAESFTHELNFIESKLLQFTQPLKESRDFIYASFQVVRVQSAIPILSGEDKYEDIEFSFSNGSSVFFEMLPQGYKRLFSIVIDIAYRSYILNGQEEPEGVVFIDEVGLHLHPSLQQEVLERFRRTFPQVQFIVSTHSPLVISNLNADGHEQKVIKLKKEEGVYSNQTVENVYGIDYATNLSEIMESSPRSSTIDKYINAYLFLYGKGKQEQANRMLDKLKEYMGTESLPTKLQEEIESKEKDY